MERIGQQLKMVRARDIVPKTAMGAGIKRRSKMGPAREEGGRTSPWERAALGVARTPLLEAKAAAPEPDAAGLRQQARDALDFVRFEVLRAGPDSRRITERAVECVDALPLDTGRLELYWEAFDALRRSGLDAQAGALLRGKIMAGVLALEEHQPEHLETYWRPKMLRRVAEQMSETNAPKNEIVRALMEADRAVGGLELERQLEQGLLNARLGARLGLPESARHSYALRRHLAREHLGWQAIESLGLRLSSRAEEAWTLGVEPALRAMAARMGFGNSEAGAGR
ncbi:MAG: hypothetical protein KGH63_00530 [Candidatus Micrarchaeota archaeon]|nr:hypothetical protein [Candidatus Micrarchaeota archaeon]